MKKIFITGTDTGIGKTVATAALNCALRKMGHSTFVMKPVQTGAFADNSKLYSQDLKFILNAAQQELNEEELNLCQPYLFRMAASPHLAAFAEKDVIIPEKIIKNAAIIKENYTPDYLLIEGAGGITVPLTTEYDTTELIQHLNAEVVLVTHTGLGTLNHTFLTLEHIKINQLKFAGVILNHTTPETTDIVKDNIAMIAKASGNNIIAEIPYFKNLDTESAESAKILDDILFTI